MGLRLISERVLTAALTDQPLLRGRMLDMLRTETRLKFDQPRHKLLMRLPLDYPRINQFPEWFVVQADQLYEVTVGKAPAAEFTGAQLAQGIPLDLDPGQTLAIQAGLAHP